METLNAIITIFYLGIVSCFDLKSKKIPLWVLMSGGVLGSVFALIDGIDFSPSSLLAFLPGLCFLVVARISEKQIGYGDGLCVLILGFMVNFRECFIVLCLSLFLISFMSLILLVTKKVNRNTKIPFIPFLFLGESICLVFNLV